MKFGNAVAPTPRAIDVKNFLLSESSKGITQAIDNLVNNKNIHKQDNEKASYTELIKKTDGLIEWNSSAEKIEAKFSIRSY